ncbi:MAG: sulfite exporter TauE/SafE family protein [Alphaproteobacteria bacterium]|nr:sulfite exporter TauE/SafE family protein [Alphaproteobacteria bacterium]
MIQTDITGTLSGLLVGVVLGLVGGGGSILAVPLLIYFVGISSPHIAIGTSAVAVAGSALVNLVPHWRAGNVKWKCALVFSASGVLGALGSAQIAKQVDGDWLLAAFGALMIVVGLAMGFKRGGPGNADVRLDASTAARLLPRLVPIGLGVGLLSGFFGIGGGFLIVPGLMLATGMPLGFAIGTSLVSVSAFGMATAGSYAVSGLVDWRLAAFFVAGGAVGGIFGALAGRWLGGKRNILRFLFAGLVVGIGGWIVWQGVTGFIS